MSVFRYKTNFYRCDIHNGHPRYDSRYQRRVITSPWHQEKAFQPNSFHPSTINSFLTTSPHFSLPSRGVSNISLIPNINTFAGSSGSPFISGGIRPYYVNNSFLYTQRKRRRRRRGKGNKKGSKNSQVINTFFQRKSYSVCHSKQNYNKFFINWTRDVTNDFFDIRAQR